MSERSYRLLWPPERFDPWEPQLDLLQYMDSHQRDGRALAVWPRRHGKDLTALHNLALQAAETVGMYWHGLPTYAQARKSCWTAFQNTSGLRLMDDVFPRGLVKRPREWAPNSEMIVELTNGSLIQFVGSDKVDSLVGAGLRGLNASEYALWKPSAFDFIRPMLRETHGWALFITTPRGHNHAWKMHEAMRQDPSLGFLSHEDIFSFGRYTRKAAERIMAEERKAGMLEELIKQEYLTSFTAALVGSYWGDLLEKLELEGALQPFQHDSDGVYVVFDLGYTDSTAIWAFRLTGDGADWIHHYASHSKPMSHYFEKLEEWQHGLGFRYEAVLLPHDAGQHSVQTGVRVVDQFVEWAKANGRPADFIRLVPDIGLLNGIQAVRRHLQQDVRIHPRCSECDGIEALRQYHREYDEDTKSFSKTPEHDWSSHSADSFRYGCVAMEMLRGYARPRQRKLITTTRVAPGMVPSLEELFRQREGGRRSGHGRRA